MERINVGFVGCGRIADLHYRGLANHPHARLHAICDPNPEVLARRAAEWGVERAYATFEELLADPGLDALELLSPQLQHEPQALAALAAGKHVAVQKPLTVDLASADRMLAAAAQSPVVFKVTENYLFYPPIVRAAELIREGAIGDLVTMRIQFMSGPEGGWQVPASAWQWRMEEARAGRGPSTFDHGHHLWSTACHLLGEPELIAGWIDSRDGLIDCPAQFIWKTANGRRCGTIQFHHGDHLRVPSDYYSNDEWIELFGSKGVLSIRRCTGKVKSGPVLQLWDGHRWTAVEGVEDDWGAGFVGSTNDFITAIREGKPPTLTGNGARTVLRFALAAGRAARLRREVYLDELEAALPWLCFVQKRRRERRERGEGGLLARLLPGGDCSRYAPQALELTRALVAGFKPPQPPLPDTAIGLILRGDGVPEMLLGLLVTDNCARLLEGELPPDPGLTVTMTPGIWAAILLKRKRIEMAVLQGRIAFTGKVEEALKLRDGFGF